MNGLTGTEQAGVLWYCAPDFTVKKVEGHFCLNGTKVIARKRGGRNRWHLCGVDDIAGWRPKGVETQIACDREDWTGEPCGWSGTLAEAGQDDGGAIVYCPHCEWIIETKGDAE